MRGVNIGTRGMTLACLGVLITGTAQTEEPRTRFRVICRKPEDRVTVEYRGDRALFTIRSPSGIGGATITRQGEPWPGAMVLRLRLRGMERLRVGNGTETLSASVASSGDHQASVSLSVKGEDEIPIARGSPFWTEVRILDDQGHPAKQIPLNDGGVFEIALPQALFAANPATITLDWVDFYR